METILGYDRFENLKRDTMWNISNLHNRYFDKSDYKDDYKEILERKMKNPTLCDIALQRELQRRSFNDTIIDSRIFDLKRDKDIFELQEKCNKKILSDYPATHKLRQKLIEANRFSLDFVTPKASKIKKILINLKAMF